MSWLYAVLRGIVLAWVAWLVAVPLHAAHDGDINDDSTVNIADLLWGIQALTGLRLLTLPQEQAGDIAPLVNGYSVPDGSFNLGDVTVLYRVIAGEIVLAFAGVPENQFNIGDSIGEGVLNGATEEVNHDIVWSTGYNGSDGVNSLNERLELLQPTTYYENNSTRDGIFNKAHSGDVMANFAGQAAAVVAASASVPGGKAGKVVVLLGANDVCTDSTAADPTEDMTTPGLFRDQYIAGLEVLANSPATRDARIDVLSIPAIYWLWNAKYDNWICRILVWPFVPCQNLLDEPSNDCVSTVSRLDPDNDYGDEGIPGSACHRRKLFHRAIRGTYNPILQDELQEYIDSGQLPNARYIDLYDVMFTSTHVSNSDCFHPSTAGHALLADTAWCRSPLGSLDTEACGN